MSIFDDISSKLTFVIHSNPWPYTGDEHGLTTIHAFLRLQQCMFSLA